jgi:hypothetical protein
MSEIEQLKERIEKSGTKGVETAVIRDDYEPAGDLMIRQLMNDGDFVSRKTPMHSFDAKWRVFKAGMEPY